MIFFLKNIFIWLFGGMAFQSWMLNCLALSHLCLFLRSDTYLWGTVAKIKYVNYITKIAFKNVHG